jgi:hypothetical protein
VSAPCLYKKLAALELGQQEHVDEVSFIFFNRSVLLCNVRPDLLL